MSWENYRFGPTCQIADPTQNVTRSGSNGKQEFWWWQEVQLNCLNKAYCRIELSYGKKRHCVLESDSDLVYNTNKDCIPALVVGPLTEPVEDGIFSKHILLVQWPHKPREQLHQLSVLIALSLHFVHKLQLKFPVCTENMQKLCPHFDLRQRKQIGKSKTILNH